MYMCKCGSLELFQERQGNRVGLYCAACGKWQKWLSKAEVRAFNQSLKTQKRETTNDEKMADNEANTEGESINSPMGDNFSESKILLDRIQEFVTYLEVQIDKELMREPLSVEDNVSKCSYAHAYEKDKNALINILLGRDWNDNGE